MDNKKEVGNRLREIRKALDYTQIEVSERTGIKQTSWANWETGRYRVKDETIKLICDKFNINYDYLKFGKGEMFDDTSQNQNNANNVNNLDNHNNQNNNNNNTYSYSYNNYSNNKNCNDDISEIDKIRIDRDIEIQGLYSDEAGILLEVMEQLSNEECKFINDIIVRLAHEILKKRSEKR